MKHQQKPPDYGFGPIDEWTENLMFKGMLAAGLRRVRHRGGLPSEAEQARIIKSGRSLNAGTCSWKNSLSL